MDREALIRRAAELVPVLRERAPQAEALRCVPPETVDDLCRADLLRAPLPARFGGLGLDFDSILTVAAELGRGCGSTAWCYGVWASDSWIVGMYPEQAQEEYCATGANTLCASCLNPAGTTSLTAVADGYRLSGQWDFASGCDAATWVLVMGAGPAGVLLFLVPRSDFAIHDTWFASGLRGTGSKDIIIHDAFVPGHRALSATDMQEARTPGGWSTTRPTIVSPFSPLPAMVWRRPWWGWPRVRWRSSSPLCKNRSLPPGVGRWPSSPVSRCG